MLTAVGLREQASDTVGEKAELRGKAFTVFMRAYDDVRDAVLYLRRKEQDADEFAPSLRGGAGRARRRGESAGEQEESQAAPKAVLSEAKVVKVENPEGLPIDSPFTN